MGLSFRMICDASNLLPSLFFFVWSVYPTRLWVFVTLKNGDQEAIYDSQVGFVHYIPWWGFWIDISIPSAMSMELALVACFSSFSSRCWYLQCIAKNITVYGADSSYNYPCQNFHYRMLGLGAHYKPSGTYVFIVLRDFVQKQIVAVELCKPVRSTQKN